MKLSYSPRRVYTKKALKNRAFDSVVEIDAIVRSRAIVETTRPIRYRTTVLAPGRYGLHVERDGSKYYFVIGPVKVKAKKGGAVKKAIRAPFRLRKNPRPIASATFALRLSRDRQKFALTVTAGSSIGRANLSFADVESRK